MSAPGKTLQTLDDLKAGVRQLIGREAYDTAFDLLDDTLKEESTLKTDLLAQQAKLNRTRRNQERGTLTLQDAEAAYTQVVYALETLLKELEAAELRADALPVALPAETSTATQKASDTIHGKRRAGKTSGFIAAQTQQPPASPHYRL
ncbi:MAG: hypothetical protein GVY26_07275 [Bacteroidetes bacterium]|jgi:chromosome segregation ATPase|nr:hypothetical protein [Bacteroidota bacterium]